jgi:hypothetical protein
MNLRVIASPTGDILWVSGALPARCTTNRGGVLFLDLQGTRPLNDTREKASRLQQQGAARPRDHQES